MMNAKYNAGDKVKFFDNEFALTPSYGVVIKQTRTKVVVESGGDKYHLLNSKDHVHQLNYD